MTKYDKLSILKMEKEFADGLTGMIWHELTSGNSDTITEIRTLPEGGVGLVMRGEGSVQSRRTQFLTIWKGCRRIAMQIMFNAGFTEEEIYKFKQFQKRT